MTRALPCAVELHDLTKSFGDVLAVDEVSAVALPGEVTALLGPNGAGKTTALRMLLGLVAQSSGTATFGGRRYDELTDPVRRVGAVLEASGCHPGRTALDHLRVLVTASRLPKDAPMRVLAETGLAVDARRRVGEFSLGMRQRLGLAAAMLGDPDVLVLDERRGGLGPGQVGRSVHRLHLPAGPVAGEQAQRGHGRDVARVDSRHRVVQQPGGGQPPGPQPVQIGEQVRHEVAAAQMQQRGTGLLTRGVEPLLDPGQAVDEARAVALLGADTAQEHHPRDPVLPHRRCQPLPGAFGVGIGVRQRPVVRGGDSDRQLPLRIRTKLNERYPHR